MKKKIIVSVVLAVVLAATMTVGCFASEATWSLYDSNHIYDNNINNLELASTTKQFSYASYSMMLSNVFNIQSKPVSNGMSHSSILYSIRKLNISYYDLYESYDDPEITVSFDEYVLNHASNYSYTQIHSDYGSTNSTTNSLNLNHSDIVLSNSLYLYNINYSSYYSSTYYGSLYEKVVFGLETYSSPHIFY